MPRKLVIENIKKIKKSIPLVESKLKIKLLISRGFISIQGSEYKEYLAEKVLKAIDFGFDVEDALLLINEDFEINFVNIKEHTHRKNLVEVRARVIGTGGKAKRTIEELTGGVIAIQGNVVGIIVDSEHSSQAIQGIISLIQGSKHGNVFSYLEKQNSELRRLSDEDLGLKYPTKNSQN